MEFNQENSFKMNLHFRLFFPKTDDKRSIEFERDYSLAILDYFAKNRAKMNSR